MKKHPVDKSVLSLMSKEQIWAIVVHYGGESGEVVARNFYRVSYGSVRRIFEVLLAHSLILNLIILVAITT